MDAQVLAALRLLLSEHGEALCADPQRCRERLAEALPGQPREVNVLLAAVRGQIVADMLDARDEPTVLLLLGPLAQRLADDLAMTPAAARWAVRTWALALGLVSDAALREHDWQVRRSRGRLRSPRAWIRVLLLVTLGGVLIAMSARWFRPASIQLPGLAIPRVLGPARQNVGEVRAFTSLGASLRCLAVAPNGETAASGGTSGVRLWDLGRGTETGRMPTAEDEPVACVAFSPDGRWVLGGIAPPNGPETRPADPPGPAKRCAIYLWDAARSGEPLGRFQGHPGGVYCAAVTPDAQQALSGGADGLLRLWDVRSRNQVRALAAHAGPVRYLAVSGDGRLALSAGTDREVHLWDLATARQVHVLRVPKATTAALAFHGRQARVLTSERRGDRHYRLHVWVIRKADAADPTSPHQPEKLCHFYAHGGPGGPHAAAFSADGSMVAFCEADGLVHLWQIDPPKEVARFRGEPGLVALLGEPKWRLLLAAGGFLRLWHWPERYVQACIEPDSERILRLAFSDDGRHLVGRSPDGTVEAWDVPSGQKRIPTRRDADRLAAPVNVPDEQRLFGAEDGSLRLWNTRSRKEIVRFEGHRGQVTCWAFSPDGRRALSGGADGTVRLWGLHELRALARFEGHHGVVTSVTFSADGRWAASAGRDRTVRLWQLSPRAPQPSTKANP